MCGKAENEELRRTIQELRAQIDWLKNSDRELKKHIKLYEITSHRGGYRGG